MFHNKDADVVVPTGFSTWQNLRIQKQKCGIQGQLFCHLRTTLKLNSRRNYMKCLLVYKSIQKYRETIKTWGIR
jgi:hypothetical protein